MGNPSNVTLESADRGCGDVVNALVLGRLARRHAGSLPVEPRKRYTFVFDAPSRWTRLPLTIGPSGRAFRTMGNTIGGLTPTDPAVAMTTSTDHSLWEDSLAASRRIHSSIRSKSIMMGRAYDYNYTGPNALSRPQSCRNFLCLQRLLGSRYAGPSLWRGIAEWMPLRHTAPGRFYGLPPDRANQR